MLDAKSLTEQAKLLARGGEEAKQAAQFLLRASICWQGERVAALEAGLVPVLLPYLHPSTPTDVFLALAQAFSNFCCYNGRSSKPPEKLELVSLALPSIKDLLYSKSELVIEVACMSLASISRGKGGRATAARAVDGMVERLRALLAHKVPSVKLAALLALGNVLVEDDFESCQQKAKKRELDAENSKGSTSDTVEECRESFSSVLQERPPLLARHVARAAAELLAKPSTIQFSLDAGLLHLLCILLENKDSECRQEAAQALANLCSTGTDDQCMYLIRDNALAPYYAALVAAGGAPPALQLLKGLNALLQAEDRDGSKLQFDFEKRMSSELHSLGILDLTEQLVKHHDKEVQSQALQLQIEVGFHVRGVTVISGDGKEVTIDFTKEDAWLVLGRVLSTAKGRDAVLAVPGLLKRFVYLMSKQEKLEAIAFQAVGELLQGDNKQKKQCIDAGCLKHIADVFEELVQPEEDFTDHEMNLVDASVRAALGILKGTPEMIQLALDAGFLNHLIGVMNFESYALICKLDAVMATLSLCRRGTPAQKDQFVAGGGLRGWAAVLRQEDDYSSNSSSDEDLFPPKKKETTTTKDSDTLNPLWRKPPHIFENVISGLDILIQAARKGEINADGLRSQLKKLKFRGLLERVSKCHITWKVFGPRNIMKQYPDFF